MEPIYLDANATTPLLPAVAEAMWPYLTEIYGNPASAHRVGARARRALEDAREKVATLLGAHADEVIFTSGATEANNIAIFGLAGTSPRQIVTSPLEHPSVADPIRHLANRGFQVDYLDVSETGHVRCESLCEKLRDDTRLLAVMLVNHETGAIQPISDLAAIVDGRTAFHCDATQAVGKIPVHFHDSQVTTLSLSAHKFHGPKGVGALLVRRGTRIRPMTWGGHQQQGSRPGTEPVALAVGLATALELWHEEARERDKRVRRLRMLFLDEVCRDTSPAILNGPRGDGAGAGIPHTLNLSFPGCAADALLIALDLAGVACSTGSACSSGSLLPSPVLQAMRVPDDVLRSAMRFSFSHLLEESDVRDAARRVVTIVRRMRDQRQSEA